MEAGGGEESSKRVGWRVTEEPDPGCGFSTLAVHENQLGSLQKILSVPKPHPLLETFNWVGEGALICSIHQFSQYEYSHRG